MSNEKIENQIEFLLSSALRKCGNIYDAEDLTQDTLMAALLYMSKGNTINDMRAWLLTVMNHKWNDSLRKKYRLPVIQIGEDFDIIDEGEDVYDFEGTDEKERVRKAIAFLAKIYREVIVRHYINGQSVADISEILGIPEGTVKSRLYSGREQMKKGIIQMENYSTQSYHPIKLHIWISGRAGINDEPRSLVQNDLLAQNILWAAYEQPIAIEEIAKTVGTPVAYVEAVIDKLVYGELMKQVGNKYYTDFIITTLADEEKFVPEQRKFVKEYFDILWSPIDDGLNKLRQRDFYKRCTLDEKNSFEMYFAFHCLDHGIYKIFCDIFKEVQQFPNRRDGGRWIAVGRVDSDDFKSKELLGYSYSGERSVFYENFSESKILRQHVYGADGFPNYSYYHCPIMRGSEDMDDIITRLLYIVHTGINPESVGFNIEYLKAIPWLTKCKILREENGRPHVNIPVINENEFNIFCGILTETKQEMFQSDKIKNIFSELYRGKKQIIPKHLDSVPLQKQYLYAGNAVLFSTIREAIKLCKLYDGNYDDNTDGVNQHPCPMILVID